MHRLNILMYFLLLVVIGITMPLYGQPTSCDLKVTGENATVIVTTNSNLICNETSLPIGSYIIAVYQKEDSLICAGYLKWMNKNDAFTIYGNDGDTDGYESGELMKFILELPDGKMIDSVLVKFQTGGIFSEGNKFQPDGIFGINSLRGFGEKTTSTKNPFLEYLSIYPNPVQDRMHLKYSFPKPVAEMIVELFSIVGPRQLWQIQDNLTSGEITVSLNNLLSGIYRLQITIGNSKQNYLIVKT